MTSRERVIQALNFEQPDRVPIDLGGMRASGIHAAVYDKLKRDMGIETPTKVCDALQVLAEVEMGVLDNLHADIIPLDVGSLGWAESPAESGVRHELPDGTVVFFGPETRIAQEADGTWVQYDAKGKALATMPKNGFYFDFVRPVMGARGIDPKSFKPADFVPEEQLEMLARRAKCLHENTDKAVIGWGAAIGLMGLSSLLSANITQGALDEWLCMLLTEKETAHEMMGRYVEATIKCLELYHQAVGDRCAAWGVASDDGGTQRGEVLSPDVFVEMIKPHYKRLCDWVHKNTNWKTVIHSCGSVYNYIPEWIDAGVDVLNPVQISAANMEPERLKKDFGGKIVFWGGGCDTQGVLPVGTPEQVRENVRHNIEIFGQGGGYIFNQVHNMQPDVPLANAKAMFEAAYEFA